MRHIRKNKGYTLVELMIATVVGMILIAGATATFIVQSRSSVGTESVSELNSQSKTALDIIAGDIRKSGGCIPRFLSRNPINGQSHVVDFTDGAAAAADTITLVGGFRDIGTIAAHPTLPQVVVNGNNIWIQGAENNIDLGDRSYINIDGVFFAEITGCTSTGGDCTDPDNSIGVTLNREVTIKVTVDRPVYLVEDVTYCVDANNDLRRIRRNANVANCTGPVGSDNELIAQNIADLQFAYAVDADGDEEIDDLNNDGNFDDADFIIDGMIDGVALDPDSIRAVRISVLAIADREDRGVNTENAPTPIENRDHVVTNDGFKRRLWQTIVTVRVVRED